MMKWETEPNEGAWVDEATGLECRITRHQRMKHLCGYVRIPNDHPLHGKTDRDEIPRPAGFETRAMDDRVGILPFFAFALSGGLDGDTIPIAVALSVHGGITFSAPIDGEGWWMGFDCSHCDDFVPGSAAFCEEHGLGTPGGVYRTWEYVERECRHLAGQIAMMVEVPDA